MSFPQRMPMGIPTGMMAPGYTFTPMGMMPMQMQMMPARPMMNPQVAIVPGQQQAVNNDSSRHKKPDTNGTDKPPVTTVFVGNISDRAPDQMLRNMLQRCGTVLSWKRVQGASGKLQEIFHQFHTLGDAHLVSVNMNTRSRLSGVYAYSMSGG